MIYKFINRKTLYTNVASSIGKYSRLSGLLMRRSILAKMLSATTRLYSMRQDKPPANDMLALMRFRVGYVRFIFIFTKSKYHEEMQKKTYTGMTVYPLGLPNFQQGRYNWSAVELNPCIEWGGGGIFCNIFIHSFWFLLPPDSSCPPYAIHHKIMHTVCCPCLCDYIIVLNECTWFVYAYSSGLLDWHWESRVIALVWINPEG